ncbi:MAG: hypothetical protein P8N27_03480, partial [Polaribacter sp.]|nr:hypothetical protein [Polaribacter sp.]
MTKKVLLHKAIEDKTIVWFENRNEYVIFENTTADILKRINKGISTKEIAAALSKKLSVPIDKTIDFILDLEHKINDTKKTNNLELVNDYRDIKKPTTYNFIKYYK